jgi:hypothetical protein
VDSLEAGDQVVTAAQSRVRCVPNLERDLHPLPSGVRPRQRDRRLVEVEAVHLGFRVCAREGDRRPSGAAGHVGDPAAGLQVFVHVGKARHPVGRQEVDELHAVHVALSPEEVRVEVGVGDPLG